jgi:hypothetical protein
MTTSAERRTLQAQLLSQLARAERQSVACYGNLTTAPDRSITRRLLSSTGFPPGTQLTYTGPASSAVETSTTIREGIQRVVLHAMGADMDVDRHRSTAIEDRRILSAQATDGRGLLRYPGDTNYLMPGYVDEDGSATTKVLRAVQGMCSLGATRSWHFLVTRAGDLLVGAALDDRTTWSSDDPEHTIDILYESLVITRTMDPTTADLIEAPLTPAQQRTLGVLMAKLEDACPEWSWSISTSGAGFTSTAMLAAQSGAALDYTPGPFTDGAWIPRATRAYNPSAVGDEGIPLDYSTSDFEGLFTIADETAHFDLATEVFRTAEANIEDDRRELARATISSQDTMGTNSAAQANYSQHAARARGVQMLDRPRTAYILRRADAAARQAADAASRAAQTESTTDTPAEPENRSVAMEASPFIYDFTTGEWGDRNPV